MGIYQGNIYSESLGMYTQIYANLPQDEPMNRNKDKPSTLILLHGLTGNASSWVRRTNLDAIVRKYNIAVFMPEVSRSFYHDLNPGLKYFKYISMELPELISKTFHVNTDCSHLMIAGLSMGGYGAMKCGLTYPKKFSKVGAFSGMYRIKDYIERYKSDETKKGILQVREDFFAIFGKNLELVQDGDLHKKFIEIENKEDIPKLYISCGKQDLLLPLSRDFHNLLVAYKFNHVYQEFNGNHEWDFWAVSLERMLKEFFK